MFSFETNQEARCSRTQYRVKCTFYGAGFRNYTDSLIIVENNEFPSIILYNFMITVKNQIHHSNSNYIRKQKYKKKQVSCKVKRCV